MISSLFVKPAAIAAIAATAKIALLVGLRYAQHDCDVSKTKRALAKDAQNLVLASFRLGVVKYFDDLSRPPK